MRRIINLNPNWRFTGPDGAVSTVSVPHTWNAIDGQDGGNDYSSLTLNAQRPRRNARSDFIA